MTRGLVVSDLHLLDRRSDGTRLLADLGERLGAVDVVVLNGDTFDFRWSRFGTEAKSVEEAVRWLESFLDGFHGEAVHFVAGNHDCHNGFQARLGELSGARPVLRCHDLHVRLGRVLFLHGDCANRRMDRHALLRSREKWSRDRVRGKARATIHRKVGELEMMRRLHRWYFPPGPTVRRVAHHLDHVVPSWREEIDDCYFGHTHVPFAGHVHDGVRFHNTGSGIRGMGFRPMTFTPGPARPDPH